MHLMGFTNAMIALVVCFGIFIGWKLVIKGVKDKTYRWAITLVSMVIMIAMVVWAFAE